MHNFSLQAFRGKARSNQDMTAADKVAINTGIQYTRVFITMGISLYSVRLLLHALGEEEYGIFNLVAGVISMFAFLNAAMATSTQRFLSFHQGKNGMAMQKKIFSNSFLLHILTAVLVVIALEIAGLFLFNGFLKISPGHRATAKIVYQCMCMAVFFGIISMPFTSLLVAHENILWVAWANTVEIVLKLSATFILFSFNKDRLIVYGVLMAALASFIFILNALYCFRKYEDCVFTRFIMRDIPVLKKLTSFAGWNLFGALCATGRYEGLAILLNLFFGSIINAAFGIASQVAAQVSFFSVAMLRAINPQIVKSEGANDRKRMLRLSMIASKSGFFLLIVFAVPCIFEMPALLGIWLKTVPENTVIFCRLVLTGTLINQLTIGLETALQATGEIKLYQLLVGLLLLCNIPLAYVLLRKGFPAFSVLLSYALIELIACGIRLFLAKKVAGLNIAEYFYRVFFKELVPVLSIFITCFLVTHYLSFNFRFLVTGIASAIVFSMTIYRTGLCKDEKQVLHAFVYKFANRIRNRNTA